jgi:hypothetical protein
VKKASPFCKLAFAHQRFARRLLLGPADRLPVLEVLYDVMKPVDRNFPETEVLWPQTLYRETV